MLSPLLTRTLFIHPPLFSITLHHHSSLSLSSLLCPYFHLFHRHLSRNHTRTNSYTQSIEQSKKKGTPPPYVNHRQLHDFSYLLDLFLPPSYVLISDVRLLLDLHEGHRGLHGGGEGQHDAHLLHLHTVCVCVCVCVCVNECGERESERERVRERE